MNDIDELTAEAARARRVAARSDDMSVVRELNEYARELEQRAIALRRTRFSAARPG